MFLCFTCFYANAQFIENPFRLDTRINVLVPHPISNKAFRNTFIGVYSISGSQNLQVFKNLYVGVFGGTSLYKIPTNKAVASNGYKLSNLFQLNSAGLNIGYNYYVTPLVFFSNSLSIGQSFGTFTSIQTVTPVTIKDKFNAPYFHIASNINFVLEDHFGIGFLISYTYVNYSFNPYDIALNQFKSYTESDLGGGMSRIEVGFNLYFGYLKKKG